MKNRLKEIDILYCVGFALVIIGHSHSSDWSRFEGTILEWLIGFIYTFHMPLFFFLAGFLFMHAKSYETAGCAKWIREKGFRLLVPYLFWSLIALVPKYYIENHGFHGLTVSYLLKTALCPRSGVWGHFWFLPALFLVYLLFAVWRLFLNAKNENVMMAGAVAASLIIYFLPIHTDFLGLADVKTHLVFFAIGAAANRRFHPIERSHWKAAGIGALFATIAAVFLYSRAGNHPVSALLGALLMISACICFAFMMPSNQAITWISNHTFTLYIFSWFFQAIVMMICDRIHLHWFMTFIAMFCAGLLGPLAMIWIYERTGFLHNRIIKRIIGART